MDWCSASGRLPAAVRNGPPGRRPRGRTGARILLRGRENTSDLELILEEAVAQEAEDAVAQEVEAQVPHEIEAEIDEELAAEIERHSNDANA